MRKEKQLLLDEVANSIDDQYGVILTKYDQLDANAAANFRRAILQVGGNYKVVKKRLLKKASEKMGIESIVSSLEGHIGVISTGENIVDVAKTLYNFISENEGKLEVLAGLYEQKPVSPKDIKQISELPSKDEMRAQILGLLEAVPSQLVSTMDALLTGIVHCINNKSELES